MTQEVLARRTALLCGGLLAMDAIAARQAGAQGTAPAPPLRVLASGAVEHALHDLALAMTQSGGPVISYVVGNAGDVSRRLRAGEPADLVINTAEQIDALARDGLVTGSRAVIGISRLGLGVRRGAPHPDIATTGALRATLLAAPVIAVPDPQGGGAAGAHLQRMFEQLGIADIMRPPRTLHLRQGRLGTEAVAAGNATLAMTQMSEIISVRGAELVGPLPDAVQLVTPYVGAVTTGARDPAGAVLLLRHFASPAGVARLRAAGFTVEG